MEENVPGIYTPKESVYQQIQYEFIHFRRIIGQAANGPRRSIER